MALKNNKNVIRILKKRNVKFANLNTSFIHSWFIKAGVDMPHLISRQFDAVVQEGQQYEDNSYR